MANIIAGQVFERLTVLLVDPPRRHKSALCQCSCGAVLRIRVDTLKSGKTKSCGCLHNDAVSSRGKHHLSGTKIYAAWSAMVDRCHNPNSQSYKNYGGRGITVCDRWKNNVELFVQDMGEPSFNTTLERIDNNGNYEPLNCKWATRLEQSNNQRGNRLITHDGQTKTVSAWARHFNMNVATLFSRLRNGKTFEQAIQ